MPSTCVDYDYKTGVGLVDRVVMPLVFIFMLFNMGLMWYYALHFHNGCFGGMRDAVFQNGERGYYEGMKFVWRKVGLMPYVDPLLAPLHAPLEKVGLLKYF